MATTLSRGLCTGSPLGALLPLAGGQRGLCTGPRRLALGSALGVASALVEGKGISFALSRVQSWAGLTKGEMSVTMVLLLFPPGLTALALTGVPHGLVNWPAAAITGGSLALTWPLMQRATRPVPPSARNLLFGLGATAAGLALSRLSWQQLAEPSAAPTGQAEAAPPAEWAQGSLGRMIQAQAAEQWDALDSEAAARYLAAGTGWAAAIGLYGRTGVWAFPIPAFGAAGLESEQVAATVFSSLLPLGLLRAVRFYKAGSRPQLIRVLPFALGMIGASTATAHVTLRYVSPDLLHLGLGGLLVLLGGAKLRSAWRLARAV